MRCAQRTIPCTYNKPQKSRSNASGPSVRALKSMSASGSATNGSFSGSSASPQPEFSSPYSMSSPTAAAVPPNVQFSRRQISMSAYAANARPDPAQSIPYLTPHPASWSTVLPRGPSFTQTPLPNPHWRPGPITYQAFDPAITVLPDSSPMTSTSSNLYELSSSMPLPQAYIPFPTRQRASTSPSASPQQHLAPTPSMTNYSNSPSSLDEPYERRTSHISNPSGVWQDLAVQKPVDPNTSFLPDPNSAVPITYSPSVIPTSFEPNMSYPSDLFANGTVAWPGTAELVDSRLQFEQSPTSEDDEASQPPSCGLAISLDADDNISAMQRPRRSSAGLWATSFNQMTLQDGSRVPIQPDMTGPSNTHTANQVPHQLHHKWPAHQMSTVPGGMDPTGMPSLSDTKDLWKLFMSESASALSPGIMGDKYNDFDASVPGPALRPGIGRRTLSKFNSMPDLTSPALLGQPFFSNYPSGSTPRPSEAQESYLSTQLPEHAIMSTTDDPAMRKWKNELQQRQTTFNMMPGGKMGEASPARPILMLPPAATALVGSSADSCTRTYTLFRASRPFVPHAASAQLYEDTLEDVERHG